MALKKSHKPKGKTCSAQDLGFEYGAPTVDYADEDNGLYSKEHCSEAHELHRREDAPPSAWRDEEDLELREKTGTDHPHSAERFT